MKHDPAREDRRLEWMAEIFRDPADQAGICCVEPYASNGYSSPIDVWFHPDKVTDEEIIARVGRYCARRTQFGATETARPTRIPPEDARVSRRGATMRPSRRSQLSCVAP